MGDIHFHVDRLLTALFLVCLFLLVAHDLFFEDWPEWFGWGPALWDLFYELCLAFAASYLFYSVVVHVKRQRDKETLRPFLYRHSLYIVGNAEAISRTLKPP
jgi:hypothetical protein